MLLFSTILDINDTLTKDDFIRLVIEWNQGSPHPEDVIPNIKWDGSRNICYGSEELWLNIQEYRNRNIIAVRYEKRDNEGVIWNTDYIMNFNDMRMSIRLDRSYLEEALAVDLKFSTPYFITLLIKKGHLKDDNGLPVRGCPEYIDESNITLLTDLITGKTRYRLPVVYVSKKYNDGDPINVKILARKLRGVAHVLVQKSNCSNARIRKLCNDRNEYYGSIGIYYPTQADRHRKYKYKDSYGADKIMFSSVFREIIQYGNRQMVRPLYTWAGVNNALLTDRLNSQRQERVEAESQRRLALYELLTLKANFNRMEEDMRKRALDDAKAEADKIVGAFSEELRETEDENQRLLNEIQRLEQENDGLRRKLDSMAAVPLLVMGEEREFYQGEIKDLILLTLREGLKGTEERTRRHDVLEDIIDANHYQGISEQNIRATKNLLKNYSGMNPKVRRGLEDMGFVLDKDGPHIKGKYYGDDRYIVIYSKTPGDHRDGRNNADNTIKKAF